MQVIKNNFVSFKILNIGEKKLPSHCHFIIKRENNTIEQSIHPCEFVLMKIVSIFHDDSKLCQNEFHVKTKLDRK